MTQLPRRDGLSLGCATKKGFEKPGFASVARWRR
jgi:hypothetical protein